MKRCDVCDGEHRRRSVYCSDRCKVRAQRARKSSRAVAKLPAPKPARLESAVLAVLTSVGRESSPDGLLALLLAARMDSVPDSGAAALSREFRAALDAATVGAAAPDSALDGLKDEVAAARAKRRGA